MAASIHGAIGVRGIAREWAGMEGRRLDMLMWGFGLVLVGLGLRAVYAVII
jgi:fumarate reductase subunit C